MINSKSLGVYSGPHHSILTPALLLYLLFTVEVMGAQRHEINCPRPLGSFFFFFFFSILFRAISMAYESSQARGGIRATATGLLHHSHSNKGSKPCL